MNKSANGRADENRLLVDALNGCKEAFANLFESYRERLELMVQLRMDHRLKGRIDASDVIQEAFIDAANKLEGFSQQTTLPFHVWLRLVVGERLQQFHRHHIGTAKRNARLESIHCQNSIPDVRSYSLAGEILCRFTSAEGKVLQNEVREKLSQALETMETIDRDVVVLRHFENMTNQEVADVHQISKSAASNRYVRAMKKLKQALMNLEGFNTTAFFGTD